VPRPAPSAVIFDCDGTLVDSEPLSRRAWEATLAPHGYAVTDADLAALIGLPYATVHAYFAERVPGLPGIDAVSAAFSGAFFTLIDAELEPFEDALALVAALADAGLPVAVASSSRRERLDRTLAIAGLTRAFPVSIAGDEVVRGKPAPDMFLEAARRLACPPERCAVIEDSSPGVAAAVEAGMVCVAIARAPGDEAALSGAHRVLERLTAEAVLAA